jgi:hypothetical protein
MKDHPPVLPDAEPEPAGRRRRLLWALGPLALVVWQGWMTLSLFGPDDPLGRLLDDQPVLSGRHPLHLYHGYLGAEAFWDRGTTCCYDPAFQAGYPKTPIFDGDCRLAELSLGLAGGKYRPAAYKLGLALSCLALPLLVLAAARGFGLGRGASCLAAAAAVLVCWGGPGRTALEDGDADLLVAALAGLLQFGSLVRFHRSPGWLPWLGILVGGWLGWLTKAVLLAALFPLVLLYYLTVGARHRRLAWHGALLGGLAGGVAANAFWLVDWVRHWWIRAPLPLGEDLLAHRTLRTVWDAPWWGGPLDRGFALALMGAALVGTLLFNQAHQRAAARLAGLGAGGLFCLAVLGIASEPLARLGTARLLVPALFFACVPAAHGAALTGRLLARPFQGRWRAAVPACGLLAAALVAAPWSLGLCGGRVSGTTPLAIGLGAERERLVETLTRVTKPGARILWEDHPDGPAGQRWVSLLPLLTGRALVGGLDPGAAIEHTYASLVDQNLAGRHVRHWTDAQLADFCRRYNIGWVVCWSEAVASRLDAWKDAERLVPVADQGRGWVYAVRRPHSFTLRGRAELLHADRRHITLGEVVPEDGKVVLSLHYQAGLRASPSRVRIEREPDTNDPIPFIRLSVSGPVARLTLTWDKR